MRNQKIGFRSVAAKRMWVIIDKILNVVLWLHDSVLLYVCLFWLLPLIIFLLISLFLYDLRPIMRSRIHDVFVYSLIGVPLWLSLRLYAQFGMTPLATHLRDWIGRIP